MKKTLFLAVLASWACTPLQAFVSGTTEVTGYAESAPNPPAGDAVFYGAKSDTGNTNGAEVHLTPGEVGYAVKEVYGGVSGSGDADDNYIHAAGTVNTEISVQDTIAGGQSAGGNACGNTLVLDKVQMPDGTVYGGKAATGEASGNTVTIAGGRLGNVIGGYSDTLSSDNRVILVGTGPYIPDSGSTLGIYVPESEDPLLIIGRSIELGDVRGFDGNTNADSSASLDVYGTGVTAHSISNFTSVKFDLCPCLQADMTILTISGDADTDLTGVDITLQPQWGIPKLVHGDQVTLIQTTGAATITGVDTESITLDKGQYAGFKGSVTLSDDGTALILTVDYIGDDPVTSAGSVKSVLETRANAMALVNGGADFLVGNGIWQVRRTAGAGRMQDAGAALPFVAVGGSSLRHETGSHIKANGMNLAVGMARQVNSHAIGAGFEYGFSNYDSYVNSLHADGKSKCWGGALLADWNLGAGWHMDTIGRVGKVRNSYSASTCGPVSYNESATYAGASIGLGYMQKAGEHGAFDTYLRYLYSHVNGGNASLTGGRHAHFRGVNSNRTVLGTRYLHDVSTTTRAYAGAGWMQQYGCGAHGNVDGATGPSPSLGGGSGLFELGLQFTPAGNKGIGVDVNITGWVGTQRGVSGGIGLRYAF